MNNKAGGPAFPVTVSNQSKKAVAGLNRDEIAASTSTIYGGMTLRDYFAAKALPSILAVYGDGIQAWAPTSKGVGGAATAAEAWAKNAYQIADAMLAERAK